MTAAWFLLGIVLLAGAWNVVTSLLIYDALKKRGRDPSFVLLRLYIPSYACEYKKLTVAETGRTGPLFHHWFASIYAALIAAVILLVI
ncbi:MAG: hypothetical protein ACYS0K_14000 [Planctomycetota bacterium]|jgi:hypothetical protein